MKDDLIKIKFINEILSLFYKQKNILLQELLEEYNSAPVPETRFLKAELRRLAMFEQKFLAQMESYYDPMPTTILQNPQQIFFILTGMRDF